LFCTEPIGWPAFRSPNHLSLKCVRASRNGTSFTTITTITAVANPVISARPLI